MRIYKMLGIFAVLLLLTLTVPASADSGKPSVAVGDVKVTPAAFMPGDTGTISVTITNPLKNLAGDTTSQQDTYNYGTGTSGSMSIGHQQTTSVTSTNTPDGAVYVKEVSLVADSPVHVVSKQQYLDLGRLGMGDPTQPLEFTIKVDENAADATYVLTLKVRTGDDDIYLNYPIYVKVDSSPLKMVINDAPKSFSTAKKSVILDIENLRPNGVTGVSVLPAGGEFTFKPMQEYIVGQIGSGEMYTVQFDVTSNNATYNGNPSFKVVYMNGINRHETEPVTIYTDHSTTAAAASAENDNTLLYVAGIILVLAVALGGVFLYMRNKRKK